MGAKVPKAVRLKISGKVQGVWFRAWACEHATKLGLDGWVRNRRDGSVEVVVAGAGDTVDRMIAACRVGPSAARVADVEISSVVAREVPIGAGFEQRPTE